MEFTNASTYLDTETIARNLLGSLLVHRVKDKLNAGSLSIEAQEKKLSKAEIGVTARIGINYAGEAAAWPLRFFLKGSPFVSGTRKNR
jgi:3-methyladenine DNA glycosylase Mpg